MDELEQQLRSALTELAEGVPPSHHAWAEQERRLALKSRRARLRPALMAAVAVAVVALIAVPVVVLNTRSEPADQAAVPTVESTTPAGPATQRPTMSLPMPDPYQPQAGETLLVRPVAVNSVPFNKSDFRTIYVYAVRRDSDPYSVLCTSSPMPYDVKINSPEQAKFGESTCVPLSPPKNGKTLWLRQNVPGGQPGVYVYVMSLNVDRVMVLRAEGGYAISYNRTPGPEFSLLIVSLNSSKPGTRWTAKDSANVSLEDG